MRSTVRLYGSAIALVSGTYSIYLATAGQGMTSSSWFMLALGLVVIVHGIVLLTDLADRLGGASGPLMVVYATLMILNQAWMVTAAGMDGGGMDGGMPGSPNLPSAASGMGWDPGMVALAVLMLVSGVLMTFRSTRMTDTM